MTTYELMSQVKGEIDVNRIVAVVASFVIVFGAGIATGATYFVHSPAPICIVIGSDGNPSPSSCANPNAYQVN